MAPIVQHYVFGYGSLICAKSRAISAPTLAKRSALPVRIQNVVRTWNKRSPTSGATYLGVQRTPTSVTSNVASDSTGGCVGVLIPMDANSPQGMKEELEALDEREVGYDRQYVPLEWIDRVDDLLDDDSKHVDDLYEGTFLDDDSSTTIGSSRNAAVWMYVPKVSQPATNEYPIPQSYVDICLRGALSISEPFMQEFVTSTIGWDPRELVELDASLRNDDDDDDDDERSNADDDDAMDDNASEAESSKGWYHRSGSSSSLTFVSPRLMRGKHRRTDSGFSSVSSLDLDDGDDVALPPSLSSSPEAWVNDRRDPVYMRADRAFSLQNAKTLDDLLLATMIGTDASTASALAAKSNNFWDRFRVKRGSKELRTIRRQRENAKVGVSSQ